MKITNNKLHKNDEAVGNIKNLRSIRQSLGLSVSALAFAAGLCITSVRDYENGIFLPSARSYNKLANVFGWQKVPEPIPRKKSQRVQEIPPQRIEFTFMAGHLYTFTERQQGRLERPTRLDGLNWDKQCVFRYEGKFGIHHQFREIFNGWTRTYTDAQLTGKFFQEVLQ